jgi:hypothetical protein
LSALHSITVVLHRPDARLCIEDEGDSRRVSVEPSECIFTPFRSWSTAYPTHLIENLFKKKGAFVLEEIIRDEDPKFFQHHVFWELLRGGGERRCC